MEDDGDDRDDTKRKNRNLGEKKRRDQFNCLVNELSSLISNTNRKMDKSTILKSTISFLKNHNEVTVRSRAHDVQEDWKPEFLSNEEFTYLIMEALEGFIMVFSTNGYIHYASENINSLLGYNPEDIVDKNIFELMHDDDQQHLYNLLQRNATEYIENQSKENEMIRFQVHLRQGSSDIREESSYDVVQFYGHFRTNQEPDKERDVLDFQDSPSSSRVLFVCVGCLCTPKLIREASLVDTTRNEFSSRHSIEWKFLFLDHRAPPIIGYLPFEVLGTSGYDYYHFDDLDKVVTCHKALIQKGELTSCYYRFLTKGQQWIWLQTRFYITYHQWNSKPEFVVCTHRVVSYAEVSKLKEEVIEQDTIEELSESDNTAPLKEMPVKDSTSSNISKADTDAYANAYQSQAKDTLIYCGERRNLLQKNSPGPLISNPPRPVAPHPMTPRPLTPQVREYQVPKYQVTTPESERTMSSLSALFDNFSGPFDPPLQIILNNSSADEYQPPISSIENGSFYNAYTTAFRPAPVNDASASAAGGETVSTGDTWDRAQTRYTDSDPSMSEESRTGQRNSEREVYAIPPLPQAILRAKREGTVMAQSSMGVQYLDPTRYVLGAVPSRPLSVTQPLGPQDQAQIQLPWQHLHRKHEEQLNRKHVELQTMIERQLEELREVKEQLMLARLGILQPINSVPENSYAQEELQNQEPHYPDVGPLPQITFPPIPTQPPQQPHPDQQHMPQ